MQAELVTVCMPAYNYGRYLEQAIKTVYEQDYRPLELVVVDDGSTDDTQEILHRMSSDSPIPVRIVFGGHKGVAAAMNRCLESASGEWIVLAHADDWSRSDRVSKLVQASTERSTLVHSAYISVDESGNPTGYDSSTDLPPAQGDALRDILYLRSDVRSVSMMFRRSTMIAAGGFDETLPVEDWQAILRLAKHGEVAYVDEALVFRRVHGANLSVRAHQTSRPISTDDFAYELLKEVTPSDLDLERIAAIHAAVVIRGSLALGSWKRAFSGIRLSWNLFPNQRLRTLTRSSTGLTSFAWLRIRPIVPALLTTKLLQLKKFWRRTI